MHSPEIASRFPLSWESLHSCPSWSGTCPVSVELPSGRSLQDEWLCRSDVFQPVGGTALLFLSSAEWFPGGLGSRGRGLTSQNETFLHLGSWPGGLQVSVCPLFLCALLLLLPLRPQQRVPFSSAGPCGDSHGKCPLVTSVQLCKWNSL